MLTSWLPTAALLYQPSRVACYRNFDPVSPVLPGGNIDYFHSSLEPVYDFGGLDTVAAVGLLFTTMIQHMARHQKMSAQRTSYLHGWR